MNRIVWAIIFNLVGVVTSACAHLLNGIELVTLDPVLNDASTVNFYSHLPKRIVEWEPDDKGSWTQSSIETDQYVFSGGHVVVQNVTYHDLTSGKIDYYRYEYNWNDGHLVEMTEFEGSGSRNNLSYKMLERTVFHYQGGRRVSIDDHKTGLETRYVFGYGKDGNISSYEGYILSAFTQKWVLSFRNVYAYDKKNRVTKIVLDGSGSDKQITTVRYEGEEAAIDMSDGEMNLVWNARGALVREFAHYPGGEYPYYRVNLTYDVRGRLVQYVTRNGDNRNLSRQRSARDLRFDLGY